MPTITTEYAENKKIGNRDLLSLRLLVGFLGERAQFGWWQTAFFHSSSRQFLDPVFSKTSMLAQYHGVVEAARCVHDELLNVGSYHLFRLTEEAEQDLHAHAAAIGTSEFPFDAMQSKQSAMNALQQFASLPGTSRTVGPVAIGNISALDTEQSTASMASTYYFSFLQDTKSYPYFVGQL